MDADGMSIKGLLATLVFVAGFVACVWIIADRSVDHQAVKQGLVQDREGHWVTPVSAETNTHHSDCDFFAAPALDVQP